MQELQRRRAFHQVKDSAKGASTSTIWSQHSHMPSHVHQLSTHPCQDQLRRGTRSPHISEAVAFLFTWLLSSQSPKQQPQPSHSLTLGCRSFLAVSFFPSSFRHHSGPPCFSLLVLATLRVDASSRSTSPPLRTISSIVSDLVTVARLFDHFERLCEAEA